MLSNEIENPPLGPSAPIPSPTTLKSEIGLQSAYGVAKK